MLLRNAARRAGLESSRGVRLRVELPSLGAALVGQWPAYKQNKSKKQRQVYVLGASLSSRLLGSAPKPSDFALQRRSR